MTWTDEQVEDFNETLAGQSAEVILGWVADQFGRSAVFACSFGAEDVALIDLIARNRFPISVFALDTGRLHEETYEVADRIRQRYDLDIRVFTPDGTAVEDLTTKRGFHSFYESIEARKECCGIRKVDPLARALYGKPAWVTGLRREQAVTRRNLPILERDDTHGGILKINPLADWTEAELWAYIKAHDVPYNALHDQGFPSIGCAPCTRAVQPGEDIRAGRWWWENPEHKECGLHTRPPVEHSSSAPRPDPSSNA